jgi:hypothetical protein
MPELALEASGSVQLKYTVTPKQQPHAMISLAQRAPNTLASL